MINATEVKDNTLSQTKEMLRHEILGRGWELWFYDLSYPQMRVRRSDGKVLELYGSTPPTTSYAAGLTADNKLISSVLHAEAGLPVPETFALSSTDDSKAIANRLFDAEKKLVVKPLDAAHGNGVTVAIDTIESFERAVEVAREFSDMVIVQEYLMQSYDVRLLCIDYTFVAGLLRLPASVVGDGKQTIDQLITEENTDDRRGINYAKELNIINIDHATRFLGKRVHDIPPAGKRVQVVGTANVGTGGSTKDISHITPSWLSAMAEQAARASRLPCCGVDFLLSSEPNLQATEAELQPKLLEINKSPSLFIHETPTEGQSMPVIKHYVDYLASL